MFRIAVCLMLYVVVLNSCKSSNSDGGEATSEAIVSNGQDMVSETVNEAPQLDVEVVVPPPEETSYPLSEEVSDESQEREQDTAINSVGLPSVVVMPPRSASEEIEAEERWDLALKESYTDGNVPRNAVVLSGEAIADRNGLKVTYLADESQPLMLGNEEDFGRIQLAWKQKFSKDFQYPKALKLCRLWANAESGYREITIELEEGGTKIHLQVYGGDVDEQDWQSLPIGTELTESTEFRLVYSEPNIKFLVNGQDVINYQPVGDFFEENFGGYWISGNYSNNGSDPKVPSTTWIQSISVSH